MRYSGGFTGKRFLCFSLKLLACGLFDGSPAAQRVSKLLQRATLRFPGERTLRGGSAACRVNGQRVFPHRDVRVETFPMFSLVLKKYVLRGSQIILARSESGRKVGFQRVFFS